MKLAKFFLAFINVVGLVLYGFTVVICGFVAYIRCNEFFTDQIVIYSVTGIVIVFAAFLLYPKEILSPTKLSPADREKFQRIM